MPLKLEELAARYSDIVAGVEAVGIGSARKTRVVLKDGSHLDIWYSASGRYSFHWERRHVDGKLYRFDNAPHHPEVRTFPHHFHNGSEGEVADSWISPHPERAVFQVMDFVRSKLGRLAEDAAREPSGDKK